MQSFSVKHIVDNTGMCGKIYDAFCGIGCFVLIGMSWFFSEQELSVFIEEIKSIKHSLIFIENKPFREKSVNTKLKQVIIDSDGCEIF